MSELIHTTLVFPLKGNQVLLGMKKRGFGEGWWNGFGGKRKEKESSVVAARRETLEESGIRMARLRLIARLLFYFDDELKIACTAYTSEVFTGEPVETDEMKPQWFDIKYLPYKKMWPADGIWLPRALGLTMGSAPLDLSVYLLDDGLPKLDRVEDADPQLIIEAFSET